MRRLGPPMALLTIGMIACGGDATPTPACDGVDLTPAQRRRAEQLTSIFENGTIELQYAYAEALGDGRGITAGRAGFTTATGDAVLVVQAYVDVVPTAPIADYLPRLHELADAEDGSLVGLDGFVDAWATAAADAAFRQAQDDVVELLYYAPALVRADDVGVCAPLGVAIIYDTIIQHGEGDDPDGLPALIGRTTDARGGDATADEAGWLREFVAQRRATLANAFDPDTRAEWAASVDRADVLLDLIDADAWQLDGPIHVDDGDFQGDIP